jgi:hypothetical protein
MEELGRLGLLPGGPSGKSRGSSPLLAGNVRKLESFLRTAIRVFWTQT